MRISEILSKESIGLNIIADSKKDLIEEMIELASRSGNFTDKDTALKEVLYREKILSTGVGKGIAIPHAKLEDIKSITGSLAVLSEPIDFESLDNKPVNIVFLILGNESAISEHLKLLSKISRIMTNESFRYKLLNARTSDEILQLLDESENRIS